MFDPNFKSHKTLAIGLSVFLLLAIAISALSVNQLRDLSSDAASKSKTTGNGSLNGQHYNLNIIGVSKDKKADMTGNNGHRIFVPLTDGPDTTTINLSKGNYQVLDANGTDVLRHSSCQALTLEIQGHHVTLSMLELPANQKGLQRLVPVSPRVAYAGIWRASGCLLGHALGFL